MSLANMDWYKRNLDWLKSNTIFLTKSGSHSYGTNIATSDVDLKGVAIPPARYFFGYLNKFEQAECKDPDAVIYDIRKFFALAADCNPNIIELLFVDANDILISSKEWEFIRAYRHLFLSQKAKHTFSGYAVSQLKRIKTHKNWLLNPVEIQPQRSDFGLPNNVTIEREQLKAFESRINKISDQLGGNGWTKDQVQLLDENLVNQVAADLDLNKSIIPIILKERQYNAALKNWAAYQKWKTERNPARSALEAKNGYDTKHSMHLVRLMRMAKEILATGRVLVKRPDAQELIEIRNGAWSYDQLIEWAERSEKELNEVVSSLPKEPDRVAIDSVLVDIVDRYYRANFL